MHSLKENDEAISWNVLNQKEEVHMKKKIFFVLSVMAVLMVASAVTYHQAGAAANHHTRLLFNMVINTDGFDTSLAISNTSKDTFNTPHESGSCTLYYYGSSATPATYTTGTMAAGAQTFVLTSATEPGFQGYVIADCSFRNAHGTAAVTNLGGTAGIGTYPALVLASPRPAVEGANA
jgi:hypothetical protein